MAVRLMLDGASASHVARRLGVDPRTVFRWKNDPAFIAEVERRCETPRATESSRANRAAAVAAAVVPASQPQRPQRREWVFNGVEYPTFEQYMAAVDATSPMMQSLRLRKAGG